MKNVIEIDSIHQKTPRIDVGHLKACGKYFMHHSALASGYVSRRQKDGIAKFYHGRFGIGWKVSLPNYDSTRFKTIEYWIARKITDPELVAAFQNAIASQNPWDLYDSIADNGFEDLLPDPMTVDDMARVALALI